MNEENRSDGVDLIALFNVLRRYKWLLLALPFVAAILAALWVSIVLRPTWEASVILEIGHMGRERGEKDDLLIVEPIANVVARMSLPSFAKGAIKFADIKPDEIGVARGGLSTLKVAQLKGAVLLDVKLRAPSAEMAKNLIQAVIVNLQKVHSEMMAVSIEKNKKQLQILTEDIQKVRTETELLRKKLLASHDWNAFDATLSATLLKDKSNELRSMIQSKLALEELLSPSRTYTTRVVDEIYVSDDPVSPNKSLIVKLAMLLGLLGAVVFAFAHNAITSKSSQ